MASHAVPSVLSPLPPSGCQTLKQNKTNKKTKAGDAATFEYRTNSEKISVQLGHTYPKHVDYLREIQTALGEHKFYDLSGNPVSASILALPGRFLVVLPGSACVDLAMVGLATSPRRHKVTRWTGSQGPCLNAHESAHPPGPATGEQTRQLLL